MDGVRGSTGERRRSVQASLALLLLGAAARADPPPPPRDRVSNCRYEDAAPPLSGPRQELVPHDDVFRPPLASDLEPRFYAGYRRVHFLKTSASAAYRNRRINAGVVAFGGNLGLWTLRNGCDGIQVGMNGGVFSQFDLSAASEDLVNADYVVGIPLTARRGPWSGRFWLYHQSSHLGDEFLIRHLIEVHRLNRSFEVADLLVSYDRDWWRLYGGGGVIVHAVPKMDRGILHWGGELRGPIGPPGGLDGLSASWTAGAHFRANQETGFRVTSTVKGGAELNNHAGRRLRLLGVFLHGAMPFGQFFVKQQTVAYGLEIQLEI